MQYCYDSYFSICNCSNLSLLPTFSRTLEYEKSFRTLSRNAMTSSLVTPCFISNCIFLRTYPILPEYFLCCFLFHEEPLSISDRPETNFTMVCPLKKLCNRGPQYFFRLVFFFV